MYFSHKDFIRGYKVAILWANTYAEGDDGEMVDVDEVGLYVTIYDFDADTEKQIIEDCTAFCNADGVVGMIESVLSDSYDSEYAGHDFALTRNGHGAGFWDRGFGEVGDKLSEIARPFGDFTCWADEDEKVHSN